MTIEIMILAALAAALVAAWPLLRHRAVRPVLNGTAGTLLVAAGVAGFLALAGSAVADDAPAATAAEPKDSTEPVSHLPSLNAPVDSAADIVIPEGRPEWVETKPVRNGPVHKFALCSDPFTTDTEARRALDEKLEEQTAEYITETLGSKLARHFIHYDAGQIRSQFVKGEYQETLESASVGPMQQHHALVEFDAGFRDQIQHQWNHAKATARLGQLGLIGGGVILLLGTIFSYFRLDTATRGYYTGRLQFMTAAAILTIVGAGALLARWIHWL